MSKKHPHQVTNKNINPQLAKIIKQAEIIKMNSEVHDEKGTGDVPSVASLNDNSTGVVDNSPELFRGKADLVDISEQIATDSVVYCDIGKGLFLVNEDRLYNYLTAYDKEVKEYYEQRDKDNEHKISLYHTIPTLVTLITSFQATTFKDWIIEAKQWEIVFVLSIIVFIGYMGFMIITLGYRKFFKKDYITKPSASRIIDQIKEKNQKNC